MKHNKLNFVNAKDVKAGQGRYDVKKVDRFIARFNTLIGRGENDWGDGSFIANDVIDRIPTLSNAEFAAAVEIAGRAGWDLMRFNDNYGSTSYKLRKQP